MVTVIVWAESHSTLSIFTLKGKKTKPQTNTATFHALGISQAERIRVGFFVLFCFHSYHRIMELFMWKRCLKSSSQTIIFN